MTDSAFHVGYAEVQVQFAGQGDFAPRSTVGGQTQANTVVVGQKVHAKLVIDEECFTVYSKQWSPPNPNDFIKYYETDDAHGEVIAHDIGDYSLNEFTGYYTDTASPLRTGSVACYIGATCEVDGQTKYLAPSLGASYYVAAPTGVSLMAAQRNLTSVDSDPNSGKGSMQLGSWVQTEEGMAFKAEITAPTINGAGTVFFMQTVVVQRERSDPGNPNLPKQPDQEMKSLNGKAELDNEIPYGKDPSFPYLHEWPIGAGKKLSHTDMINRLATFDSPSAALELNPTVNNVTRHYTTYKVDDSFVMYLMYKPNGVGSISVPVQQLAWTWNAEAKWEYNFNLLEWNWDVANPFASTNQGVGTSVTVLPTWERNAAVTLAEGYKDKP